MKNGIIVGAALLGVALAAPAAGEETLSDQEANEILGMFGFGVPLDEIGTIQTQILKNENFVRCSTSGDLKVVDWDRVQQGIETRTAILSDEIRADAVYEMRTSLSSDEAAEVRAFLESDVGQKLYEVMPRVFKNMMQRSTSGYLEIKKDIQTEYGLNEPGKFSIRATCD